MNLLKDLLYNKDNSALDISRLSSALGVLTYLGSTGWHTYANASFDPVAFGTGWAAVCAGCAGWIYARQKFETGKATE